MKSFKSILALVAMLVLLGSAAMAAPKTIIVNKSGDPDTTNTVAGASRLTAVGDTIEITDSGVYDETASIVLRGVTLKCTAGTRATVKSSAASGTAGFVAVLVDAQNATIENILFVGQDITAGIGQHCIWAAGTIAIHNCFIRDFVGGYALNGWVRKDMLMAGEIIGTYMINSGGIGGPTIRFQIMDTNVPSKAGQAVAEADRPTVANVGPFVIDHCTIMGFANNQIGIGVYYPTWGENMTLKNTIIGPFKKSEATLTAALTQWGGVFHIEPLLDANNSPSLAGGHPGTYPADRATNYWKATRNNNCYTYVAGDMLTWQWGAPSGWDMKNATTPGPGDLVGKDKAVDPGFMDIFGYDLTLKSTSKMIEKGEDGSTVGAWQAPGPALPQIIVRKDGLDGAKIKLSAALAASTPGDVIEFQDSGIYEETVNLEMQGVTIRGAEGQRPTIKCTAKSSGKFTWVLTGQNFNLQNLNIEGQGANVQQGIVGSGMISIKNCTIKNGNLNFGSNGQGALGITITDTYLLECGGMLSLTSWAGNKADILPVLIDHCTMIGKIWPLAPGGTGTPAAAPYIMLNKSYMDVSQMAGSNVTIKNTIMGTYDGTAWIKPPSVFAREGAGSILVNHTYNLYADPTATFVLDATEVKGDPLFKTMPPVTAADGEVLMTPTRTPAYMKAEEAKTIGVFQLPPLNASKSWTVFE